MVEINELKALRPRIDPDVGNILVVLLETGKTLLFAQLGKIEGDCWVLKWGKDLFMTVSRGSLIWAFCPDEYLKQATSAIQAAQSMSMVMSLVTVEGLKVIIGSAAMEGTFGAATVTSGLSTLGGGSVAAGGFGMVGWIVVIAAAAGALTAHSAYNATRALDGTPQNARAVGVFSLVAATAGTAGSYTAVMSSATAGTSGAAIITSGLANLGGGSIASGGAGMMGGLCVVAAIPVATVGASAGLVYWYMKQSTKRQNIYAYR